MIKCLICNKDKKVEFLEEYIVEIKEDKNYFEGAKIYRCDDCDFSFVNPMPSDTVLDSASVFGRKSTKLFLTLQWLNSAWVFL